MSTQMDKAIIQTSTQMIAGAPVVIKGNDNEIKLIRTVFTGLKSLSFSKDPKFSNYVDSFFLKQSSDLHLVNKLTSSLSSIESIIPYKKSSHIGMEASDLEKIYKRDIQDFEDRVSIIQETLLDIIDSFSND